MSLQLRKCRLIKRMTYQMQSLRPTRRGLICNLSSPVSKMRHRAMLCNAMMQLSPQSAKKLTVNSNLPCRGNKSRHKTHTQNTYKVVAVLRQALTHGAETLLVVLDSITAQLVRMSHLVLMLVALAQRIMRKFSQWRKMLSTQKSMPALPELLGHKVAQGTQH